PRLRDGGPARQRDHRASGRALPRYPAGPAVLSGVGDRLPDRLSDGVRRDGRARAPRARGRKLARADLARADRAVARRTRPGAGGRAQGRAEGIHVSGAGALVDDERHAGWSAAPSRAGGAPLRDAAALGPALGAARPSRAGVAGANGVEDKRLRFHGLREAVNEHEKVGREPRPVGIGAHLEKNRRTRGLARGNPQQNEPSGRNAMSELRFTTLTPETMTADQK